MSTFSQLKEFNKLFNEYNERFIRFACGYVKEARGRKTSFPKRL